MNNNNENSELNKPAVLSFYDFAKNYIKIKDGVNERSFNDEELKQVKEIEEMMNKGYELRLVHFRKGTKVMWYKKNSN